MSDPKPEQVTNTAPPDIQPKSPPEPERAAGDRIEVSVGDVGQGAQIAAGRSITQIGSLAINVLKANVKPVLILLSVALIGIVAILYVLVRPDTRPMVEDGRLNIAVAALDHQRDGQRARPDKGEAVANALAKALRGQLSEGDFQIWGPTERVLRIGGGDAKDQAAAAAQLADKIRAHVLIFGSLREGNSIEVEPKMYVKVDSFALGEELLAQELTDVYRLGPTILAECGVEEPRCIRRLEQELAGRAVPLARFAGGLSAHVSGDFEGAVAEFAAAEEGARAWEDEEGKNVFYLFLGAAELNRGIAAVEEYVEKREQGQLVAAQGHFDQARTWFDRANRERADYARSFLGHGFADMHEARLLLAAGDGREADVAQLSDRAVAAFQTGLNAEFKPLNADVDAKAHYGLGWAYLFKSSIDGENLWDASEREFRWVIDAFEAGNERIQELAARSHAYLGLQAKGRGQDEEAIQAFDCAVELGRYSALKARWEAQRDELCPESGCVVQQEKGQCYGK